MTRVAPICPAHIHPCVLLDPMDARPSHCMPRTSLPTTCSMCPLGPGSPAALPAWGCSGHACRLAGGINKCRNKQGLLPEPEPLLVAACKAPPAVGQRAARSRPGPTPFNKFITGFEETSL